MKKLTCKRLVNSILDKKNIFTFYALILGIIAIPLMVSTMQSPKTFISRAMVIGDNAFGGGEADAEAGVPIIEGGSTDNLIVDEVPRDVVVDYDPQDLNDIYRDKKELREEQRDEVILNITPTPDQPNAAPATTGVPTPTIVVKNKNGIYTTELYGDKYYTYLTGGSLAGAIGEEAWGDCIKNRQDNDPNAAMAACTEVAKTAYNAYTKNHSLTESQQRFDDALSQVRNFTDKSKPVSEQVLWDAANMLKSGNASDGYRALKNAESLDLSRQNLAKTFDKFSLSDITKVNDWGGNKDEYGNTIIINPDGGYNIIKTGTEYFTTVKVENLPSYANINQNILNYLVDNAKGRINNFTDQDKKSVLNGDGFINVFTFGNFNGNLKFSIDPSDSTKIIVTIDGKKLEGNFKLPEATVTTAPPPTELTFDGSKLPLNPEDGTMPTTTPIAPVVTTDAPTTAKPPPDFSDPNSADTKLFNDYAKDFLLNSLYKSDSLKDKLRRFLDEETITHEMTINNNKYHYSFSIDGLGQINVKVDGKILPPSDLPLPKIIVPETETVPSITPTPNAKPTPDLIDSVPDELKVYYRQTQSLIENDYDYRYILEKFPDLSTDRAQILLINLRGKVCEYDDKLCEDNWIPQIVLDTAKEKNIDPKDAFIKFANAYNNSSNVNQLYYDTPQLSYYDNKVYTIGTANKGLLFNIKDENGNNIKWDYIDYAHAIPALEKYIASKGVSSETLPAAPSQPTTPTLLSSTSDLKNDMISKAMEYCRLFQKSDCPEIDEQLQTITDINKLGVAINSYGLNPNAQTPIPQPDSKQTTTNPAQTTLSLIGCLATLKYSLMDCLKGVIIPVASTPTPDTTTQPLPAQPTETPAAPQTFGALTDQEALENAKQDLSNANEGDLIIFLDDLMDKKMLDTTQINALKDAITNQKDLQIDLSIDGINYTIYVEENNPEASIIGFDKDNNTVLDKIVNKNLITPFLNKTIKDNTTQTSQNNEDIDQERMEWWTAWEKSVRNIFGNLLKASPELAKPSTIPPTPTPRNFETGTVVNHRKADDPPANVVPDMNVFGSVIGNNLESKIIKPGNPRLNFGDKDAKDTTGLSIFKVDGVGESDAPQLTTLIKTADGTYINNPVFTALYNLNNWKWDDNNKKTDGIENGSIPPNPGDKSGGENWGANAASLLTPETAIFTVPKVKDGSNVKVYVLYAEDDKITLRYVNQGVQIYDSVASSGSNDHAFTLHLTNLSVSKDIVDQVKANGYGVDRAKLVELTVGDIFGTPAVGKDVTVAIMANGSLMDPRVKKDWLVSAPEPANEGLFKIEEAAKGPNGTNVVREFNTINTGMTPGKSEDAQKLFELGDKFTTVIAFETNITYKSETDPRHPEVNSIFDGSVEYTNYYSCPSSQNNCANKVGAMGIRPFDPDMPLKAPVAANGNSYDIGGGNAVMIAWISADKKTIALNTTPDALGIAPVPTFKDGKQSGGGGYTIVISGEGLRLNEQLIQTFNEAVKNNSKAFPAMPAGKRFGTITGEFKIFTYNDGKLVNPLTLFKAEG